MRRLKIPGRKIGRLIPNSWHRYFIEDSGTNRTEYTYRFKDDTDLPISNPDGKGGLVSPIVLSANAIRTFWDSPWKDDPQLITRHNNPDGEIDINSRDRMGMPVKSPVPDEWYVRKLTVVAHLEHSVGILSNGRVFPEGRCWCQETRFSDN